MLLVLGQPLIHFPLFKTGSNLKLFHLSHFANFMQHRLIQHSSIIDSNYRDINRTLMNIQLETKSGKIFGIQNQSQNVSSNIHNRSLQWTKIYGQQIFKNYLKSSNMAVSVPWFINSR